MYLHGECRGFESLSTHLEELLRRPEQRLATGMDEEDIAGFKT